MDYVDGQCKFALFGKDNCYGGACEGDCEITDDTISWYFPAAADAPYVWNKGAGCWGPFEPEGRKYSFDMTFEPYGDGQFWLWQTTE